MSSAPIKSNQMFVYFHNQLLLLFGSILIVSICYNLANMSNAKMVSLNFEVFGRVQGVFFRKYTEQEARKLKLHGWCMNTEKGTVQGVVEGDSNHVQEMKNWLKTVGSPSSRIDRAEFGEEKEIKKFSFDGFKIRH